MMSMQPSFDDGHEDKCKVTVEPGNNISADNNMAMSIRICGSQNHTDLLKLDPAIFQQHFAKLRPCTFNLTILNVGNIYCIEMHVEIAGKEEFLLNSVTICKGRKEETSQTFPCYRWFTEDITEMTLFEGTAVLPQNETESYLKKRRKLELEKTKEVYAWQSQVAGTLFARLPGFIINGTKGVMLPRDEHFGGSKEMAMKFKKLGSAVNAAIAKVIGVVGGVAKYIWGTRSSILEDKKTLITSLIKHSDVLSHIMEHWMEDEEFGRQALQGVNPTKIARVRKLPENFPVTNEMIKGSLESGTTLEKEIQRGNVYILAYPELEEFCAPRAGQAHFLCAPMCLLYVKSNALIPIAIQLTTNPTKDTPIFTKRDDVTGNGKEFSDWLLAKMWVRTADTNVHQIAVHFLGTHLLMEPIAMVVMRNLSSRHPVFKLLIPHTRYVMKINTLAREILLPEVFPKLFALGEKENEHLEFAARIYKKTTFASLNVPQELINRGVDDASKLPGYFYRDDVFPLWKAIESFVANTVNIYYERDEDVLGDNELNAMITDLKENGYHSNMGILVESKVDLIAFLTTVIFCCSCQHAAVNFGQMDQFGYTPNAPVCLMMPPPASKNPEGFDNEAMKKLLPTQDMSQTALGLASLLSMYHADDVYLGSYPDEHFLDINTRHAIIDFQSELKKISETIHRRNRTVSVKYEYLLPEKIPNSIAI